MSLYKFTDPESGQVFEIQGPTGFTREQAEAVFQQQRESGALVGFRSGDVLNAEVQSSAGLASADSQVAQSLAGIAGGPTGALGGVYNNSTSSATVLSNGMRGAYGASTSVQARTLASVTRSIANTPVTNGINVASYARQASALVPIRNIGVPALTGALAQAQQLVGQGPTGFSNSLGVGQYGLDCNQLELAGYVKPGTNARYLASGTNDLTSVLSSPTVWTGKGGIKNVDGLLSSVPAQNNIQQTLMSNGLGTVAQLGIPVSKMNPQALAGTAVNAAKSAKDTLAWATDKLPSSVKSAYDTVARNVAYAVDFAGSKITDAMKGLSSPTPAIDTVNRSTLNAATKRIIGNPKIPEVTYTDT